MLQSTIQDIERDIEEARREGVPAEKLEALVNYVDDLKSGRRMLSQERGLCYRVVQDNGRTVVQMASAPVLSQNEEEEDGLIKKLLNKLQFKPAR